MFHFHMYFMTRILKFAGIIMERATEEEEEEEEEGGREDGWKRKERK